MNGVIILLVVLTVITLGLCIWLSVWLWRQKGILNRIGAAAAVVAAVCLIAVWMLVIYMFHVLKLPLCY